MAARRISADDKKLILMDIPKLPCENCKYGSECRGCKPAIEKEKLLNILREKGLLVIKLKVDRRKELKAIIKGATEELRQIDEQLPDSCKKL